VLGEATQPVSRIAFRMGHGNNHDVIASDAENEVIRKALELTPPRISCVGRPSLGRLFDPFQSASDFFHEADGKLDTYSSMKITSGFNFGKRIGIEA
jgi:hypothetical protein